MSEDPPSDQPPPDQSNIDAQFNASLDDANVILGNQGSINQFAGTEIHIHTLPPQLRRWGAVGAVTLFGLLLLIVIQQRSETPNKLPPWNQAGKSSAAVAVVAITPRPPTPIPAVGLTWPIQFRETFDSNAQKWDIGQDESEFGVSTTILTVDQGYQLIQSEATSDGFLLRITTPQTLTTDKFYFAADVSKVRGPAESACGLTASQQNGGGYFFRIEEAQGSFSINYLKPDGWWTTIIEPRENPQIKPEQVYRLAIQADGPVLSFWINGLRMASYTLNDQGETDRFVSIDLSSELMTVDESACQFDSIEIRWP